MPHVVLAGFLVVHGLITASIGAGGVSNPGAPAMALPTWFGWWPGPFGRSWLFDSLQLGSGAAVAGGLVWLAAGVALLGAGLGWFGMPILAGVWQALAVGGAALGLLALALYFHPIYLVAIVIDVAILALLAGQQSPAR
jgi:hypothetical protein